WGLKPHFAEVASVAAGVRNAYAEITQLGVDRWLALVATWRKFGSAACIVDCGTAVTIDGLDGTGRHLGGLILPGVSMMQQVLYQTASGIPAAGAVRFQRGLADNTRQGVLNGCTMAVVALINRTVDELRGSAGDGLACVITGGAATEILPLLHAGFVHEPLLVLEGLAIIAGVTA
ncbi:MAG: type III pantothenate kinase, partial [Gammaproteobacteria bacterium]